MADLLIRNVPAATVELLKRRAERYKRSVEAEALALIVEGARATGEDFAEEVPRLRLEGKIAFDAREAPDAREDRSR